MPSLILVSYPEVKIVLIWDLFRALAMYHDKGRT